VPALEEGHIAVSPLVEDGLVTSVPTPEDKSLVRQNQFDSELCISMKLPMNFDIILSVVI